MTQEDQLDTVRLAWRLREPTEGARTFDVRMGSALDVSRHTVARLRRKLGLRLQLREPRPHVLRDRETQCP